MPFISIQLNSNRPEKLVEFFDNIEATADRPEDIEVLLHIDAGDTRMEKIVTQEKARRKFTLRILQTDLVKSYATLWKPLNPLFRMTHADVYFVANLFDEVRFETKGWDSIIRQYAGYYPDHIFRLRCSKYRFRNYTDFWECGYAPDSLAFYTRRWLELGGDWNPCLGPDSFQQCVAFYLMTSDNRPPYRQYNRDIAVPDIYFKGEGAGIGLEGEALYRRLVVNNRAWFILMSHKMQQEANRRAMRMKAWIIADAKDGEVEEDTCRRIFIVKNRKSLKVIAETPYRLSWAETSLVNWRRIPFMLYYAGGGEALRNPMAASLFFVFCSYFPYGTQLMTGVGTLIKFHKRWYRNAMSVLKGAIPKKMQPEVMNADTVGRIMDTLLTASPHNGDVLISIRLSSNNLTNITDFLDAMEKTAVNPEKIEVIIRADVQIPARKVKLRHVIQGDTADYKDNNAYFIARLSDEIRFETPGWDKELEQYIGYYSDHIFRLRCSARRFHNYMDVRECISVPDNITFYTRKWLSLQGKQEISLGHDAFQQCVAFYLFTGDPFCHTQYYRDIALPHIRFSGESAKELNDNACQAVPFEIRQAARKHAMLLKAAIMAED